MVRRDALLYQVSHKPFLFVVQLLVHTCELLVNCVAIFFAYPHSNRLFDVLPLCELLAWVGVFPE